MKIDSGLWQASQFSIRTSDRRVFRRCLRKWNFQSSLRQNLTRDGVEQNINFWFGSAIHFAMEDYHGYNKFGDPRRAFYAYYHAFKEDEMPMGAESMYPLGLSMLGYYMQWYERHNTQTQFETAWIDPKTYEPKEPGEEGAVPAVEITFYYPLYVYACVDVKSGQIVSSFKYPEEMRRGELQQKVSWLPEEWDRDSDPDIIYHYGDTAYFIRGIFYHGTIDRIVKDRYGRYWLWDYKTAKGADIAKLATDDQVTAYLVAARKLFPFPVYGFVYLQLTKAQIVEPKRLKNGTLSRDKRQRTTYGLLRKAIIEDYGSVSAAPADLIEYLNYMAEQEQPEGDRFVRWDFVKRTPEQLDSHIEAIYGELDVMLNPNLVCYPSPTRDCSWDCPLREACIAYDMKDWDMYGEIVGQFKKRPHEDDGNEDDWRGKIAWPGEFSDETQTTTNPLVPMDEILKYNEAIQFDESVVDDNGEFKFMYEEEC